MQCIYIYIYIYVCMYIYIYAYIYIYIIDIYYYILWIGRPTMVGICNSWEKGNVHADEPPIVIAKPPEVTPKGHTYGFPMLAPSLFSCLALCVHQNPLVGFWVETVHGRHRLMSCDPLADMVKTGQDTRLAEPLVECDHIFENSQYMYIYIHMCMSPVPDRHFPFPLLPIAWSPRLHWTFHLHAICSVWEPQPRHWTLSSCMSSTYCPRPGYVLPIAYLAHGLPLMCYIFATYRLYTESVPMHTILVYAWMQYALTNVYIYIYI